ncbi:MAG: anaerobic C4-dicarboxylate transporter [Propionibacteriaceae bacterium]|jgi:anaerobic C4-dicarboxylate transporter DcuA|nr:anaerobic C4-dicarboxylate transporter [Propionibacteriaceae bacterium]
MDTFLLILQTVILFGAIFLGVRIGGIGIGFCAGLGALLLGATGLPLKGIASASVSCSGDAASTCTASVAQYIPFDVVAIIMAVIGAIAAMQVAGGLDVLVNWAEKVLRKHPKHISIYAPILSWLLTIMCGTGNVSIALAPVIVEVAKENNVRPSRPLSISVVASQIGITASPISAAVVWLAAQLESMTNMGFGYTANVGYVSLLAVSIPSSLVAVIIVGFVISATDHKPLDQDPEYARRVADGSCTLRAKEAFVAKPGAKASVAVFISAVVIICIYAILISDNVKLIKNPAIDRTSGIIAIMLAAGAIIVMIGKVNVAEILSVSTFKAGMNAAICIIGVAWLGTVYVNGHSKQIQHLAGNILNSQPWLLAVVLFFASALLYSQASTAKAMMPIAFAASMSPVAIVGSFAAVSGLFVLPTYPTLLAAVQMDDTGSTRIGKYVFNHPFFIPGVATIAVAVACAFGLGALIL